MPSAYYPSLGGVEELTRRLAAELRSQGHQVQVWTSRRDGDDWAEVEELDGVTVRRFTFPMPRASVAALLLWPLRALPVLWALGRARRSFRPDVLHVQCFSSNGIYAALLSRLTGTPLVVTLQGETVMDDRDIYAHSQSLRAGLRFGLRRAARITACSQFTLDDAVKRFGADPQRSSVVFNGVSLDEGAEQEAVTVPFDRFALAMGRVVRKKGFDLLLEALARVPDLPEGCGLVLGGEGEELHALRRRTGELGIDSRVAFVGRLDRPQVAWAMAHAACFVMPSRLEPFGIVVLEAWRAGTAVIASALGGAPEFVEDGTTGLVVDPHDSDALATALQVLLTDAQRAAALGAAGQARVADFTWDSLTRSYLSVYAQAVAA